MVFWSGFSVAVAAVTTRGTWFNTVMRAVPVAEPDLAVTRNGPPGVFVLVNVAESAGLAAGAKAPLVVVLTAQTKSVVGVSAPPN